jgi:hypothetical protein
VAVAVYEIAGAADGGHLVTPVAVVVKSIAYPYFAVVAGVVKKLVDFAFSASPG